MSFKPFSIDHGKKDNELDPIEIFNSLTLRGSVNDLWPPQIDALRKWNALRLKPDVSIEMNTGGGKTLVGLLIATSLARESGRMVLFACPTKQLVQQTVARARECSIQTATYYETKWVDKHIAASATGPCITTHQALFTGLSTFKDSSLGAVVLDDAHAAGVAIRDCFTLILPRTSPLYSSIAAVLKPYFVRTGFELTFSEVVSGTARELLFVPLFESSKYSALLREALVGGKVADELATKFAWAHVKDRLDRCVILINNDQIEIAPACSPTEETPLFEKGVRRVYLSATLPSPIEFYRTFGTVPAPVRPAGRSGEAQRVFLAAKGRSDDEQRDDAMDLLARDKALVLTNSGARADKWKNSADLFQRKDGHERVEEFAAAKAPAKLVIAARYDGIDLPGDACRILVIDGLPRGERLLSRYLNESLRIEVMRAATTAIRIVQATGRIFRSNTDHGAVVLVGHDLQQWLASPANRAFLPPLLQQQLDLAEAIDSHIEDDEFTAANVLYELLKGTKSWDEFYNKNIGQFKTTPPQSPPEWLIAAIQTERSAHSKLWSGDYTGAAELYANAANDVGSHDADLSAWNRHFEGYCLERSGRSNLALTAYNLAASQRASLGRPQDSMVGAPKIAKGTASPQARAVTEHLVDNGLKTITIMKRVLSTLVLGEATKPAEQALKDLGDSLGLKASRPDKDDEKGPDVVWIAADSKSGWAFEAKTDKGEGSNYTKDDIGQAHNHEQWIADWHGKKEMGLSFVGRVLPVTPAASPSARLTVIDLEYLRDLARRAQRMHEALSTKPPDADAAEAWLVHLGLKFPQCIKSMTMTRALDLQVT